MNKNIPGVGPLVRDGNDDLTATELASLKQHLAEKLQELDALSDTGDMGSASQ